MWVRLCVDLDGAGNVCGASWEHHSDDGSIEAFGTAAFGPFDTPHEVLTSLADAHLVEIGQHHTLF